MMKSSTLSFQSKGHPMVKGDPVEPEISVYTPFAPCSAIGVPMVVPGNVALVGAPVVAHDNAVPLLKQKMMEDGYSDGLISSMIQLKSEFAKQMWIVDNSGSMTICDGNLLVHGSSFANCSRWGELQECVRAHIKLSGDLQFPTSFRLLNSPVYNAGPQQFGVCESAHSNADRDVEKCLGIMARSRPEGCTPLAHHVRAISREIQGMMPSLKASAKKVSVVICTDGVPTDATRNQFVAELRQLPSRYVTLVIRLCTDEDSVVQFYNELDKELEIAVDVIDDFRGEALETVQVNPWLNYSMPLHQLREMGYSSRVLDFLDERPLTKREQVEVCSIIFGADKMRLCPDPCLDWSGFLAHIDFILRSEKLQWDPICGAMKPWVNFRKTNSKLRKGRRMKRKLASPSVLGCFGG